MTDADTESRDVDSEDIARRLYKVSQKPDNEAEENKVNIEWAKGILDITPPGRKEEFSTEDINTALKQMSQEDPFEVAMDLLWLCLYDIFGTFPIRFLPRIQGDLRNTQYTTIHFNVWLSNWDDSPASLVIKWRQDKLSQFSPERVVC